MTENLSYRDTKENVSVSTPRSQLEPDYVAYPITITYFNKSFEIEDLKQAQKFSDDFVNDKKSFSCRPEHMFQALGSKHNIKNTTDNNEKPVSNQYMNLTDFEEKPVNLNTSISNHVKNNTTVEYVKNPIVEDNNNEFQQEITDDKDENRFGKFLLYLQDEALNQVKTPIIKSILLALVVILYIIYFAFAMKNKPPFVFPTNTDHEIIYKKYLFANNPGIGLFFITITVALLLIWDYLPTRYAKKILDNTNLMIKYQQLVDKLEKIPNIRVYIRWIIICLVALICLIYLLATMTDYRNLKSLIGLFLLLLIGTLLSYQPSKINVRTVVVGVLLQFILGVCTMRTSFGYELLSFLGRKVEHFLSYTDYGSRLVFGEKFTDHYFVFKAMPVIIFFSSVINVLYYFGAIQYVILKVSWVINMMMDTSPTESISSTANIFLGMSEAPLLVKPFLPKMTKSELFSIMTGGFATVSGSVFAAYIGFGIPVNHLLIASFMSAPAALAVAKIMCPETEKTNASWEAIRKFPRIEVNSVFEVIANGAISAASVVSNIVCCLIAFVAIFNLLDALTAWFLEFLNIENAGFSTVLQYVFWPLAASIGIPLEDCLSVGKLIGLKTFINEFVAYRELGNAINFRKQILEENTYELYKNGSLKVPQSISMVWNEKSIVISTYALCGFSNFGSIGIIIGSLTALCPSRSKVYAQIAFKALIAGNIACLMTGCIAGLLI